VDVFHEKAKKKTYLSLFNIFEFLLSPKKMVASSHDTCYNRRQAQRRPPGRNHSPEERRAPQVPVDEKVLAQAGHVIGMGGR
jgi:hypothetical protein